MGHWDGGKSLHLVHVMFRPLSYSSYCHVPSNLGNRQLEQGRIFFLMGDGLPKVSAIGSFLAIKSSFSLCHITAMCWDSSYEYLVVLSQFVKHQHCVKGSFGLYFGVFKGHNFLKFI